MTGGPVMRGRPYLIGESGPEMYVPPVSGRVVGRDEVQRWFGMDEARGASVDDLLDEGWDE